MGTTQHSVIRRVIGLYEGQDLRGRRDVVVRAKLLSEWVVKHGVEQQRQI